MDMETHISQVIIDTSTPETMLEGVALTYQRATMRKHTKGGYRNAVDEMWRVAEEYNVDTIIMYDQISCKGMDGLQGIFDEQARERNINFIWVQQDLMDPRTISRRDMRRQVNQYMTSVLRETPVDPTLLDFETVKLPPYISAVLSFAVARFGTMVETVAASRNTSALLNFAPHPIGSPARGAGSFAAEGLI